MNLYDKQIDVTILMPCLDEIKTLPYCIEWAREALVELENMACAGRYLFLIMAVRTEARNFPKNRAAG